jgi:hypothetical protein
MKNVVRGNGGTPDCFRCPWCKDKENKPVYMSCPAEKDVKGAGKAMSTSLRLLCISLGVSRTEFPVTGE